MLGLIDEESSLATFAVRNNFFLVQIKNISKEEGTQSSSVLQLFIVLIYRFLGKVTGEWRGEGN